MQLSDQQEKRLGKHTKEFEEFHVEIAKEIYKQAAQIGGMDVFSSDESGNLSKIEWKDIELDLETELQPWPAGLLADSPAMRQQQSMQMVNLPGMEPVAMDLMRYPDTEEALSEAFAIKDYQKKQYKQLLRGEAIDPPSRERMVEQMYPFWQNMQFKADVDEVGPEIMGKIRAWLSQANKIITQINAERMQQMQMMQQASQQTQQGGGSNGQGQSGNSSS